MKIEKSIRLKNTFNFETHSFHVIRIHFDTSGWSLSQLSHSLPCEYLYKLFSIYVFQIINWVLQFREFNDIACRFLICRYHFLCFFYASRRDM